MKRKFLSLLVVFSCVFSVYGCTDEEKAKAKESYESIVSTIETNNEEIKTSIQEVQDVIDSKGKPLENEALDAAEQAIADADGKLVEIPDMPSSTEEIKKEIKKLNKKTDISETISNLKTAKENLETSKKQRKQLTNPSEDFVKSRLSGIANITGIQAVTEDHDPNGNLNKAGGYTAAVYFSTDLINQEEVYGDDIVEKGTEGGGCIEVYKTVKEANKRNDYLASYDGTIFSSGSHMVLGTVVIRTSDNLTATQQQEMTENIKNRLIELE